MTPARRNLLLAIGAGIAALAVVAWALGLFTPQAAPPAAVAEPPGAPEEGLSLDPNAVARMGLQTAKAVAAQYRAEITGFGQVAAVDLLAQADSDLATAEATAQASRAALVRARELFQADLSISRQALETAQRQAAVDEAQLALAQRKAVAVFGQHPPWRTAAERSAEMARLTSGMDVLVRATFPSGAVSTPPQQLVVRRPDKNTGMRWTSVAVWDAPADATIPGRSFFALVRGSDLTQGERVLTAALQGQVLSGVLVPAEAILLSEGMAWCYVVTAPGMFEKRPVDISKPIEGGYFVTQAVGAGDTVVTQGAAYLLARERNPSTEAE
jgi:hypothetical protein